MKNNLLERRKQLGITQQDVANATEQMTRAYQRYEYGMSMPSVKMALKLAKALETTVEELFVLEDDD